MGPADSSVGSAIPPHPCRLMIASLNHPHADDSVCVIPKDQRWPGKCGAIIQTTGFKCSASPYHLIESHKSGERYNHVRCFRRLFGHNMLDARRINNAKEVHCRCLRKPSRLRCCQHRTQLHCQPGSGFIGYYQCPSRFTFHTSLIARTICEHVWVLKRWRCELNEC